jgi:polyhydroxyalkanoic acid synthase PhaR subunit
MMNPQEVWQHWFDATVGVWRKAAESGGDPLGLITLWLKLMEETQAKIRSGEALPTNLFAFYKQWYDTTSETWARFVEETLGSEKFVEIIRPFLESHASFIKIFRNAEEAYLRSLQIPTRSDVAHVAELVIALEEKVDQIDDALEQGRDQIATRESMAALDERLSQLERKLDSLSTVLEKVSTVEALAQPLDRLESKLDALPPALEQVGKTEHLTQRMDQVENKLNAVLATLDKLAAQVAAEPAQHSNPAPRKASRKKTSQQEANSSESPAQ